MMEGWEEGRWERNQGWSKSMYYYRSTNLVVRPRSVCIQHESWTTAETDTGTREMLFISPSCAHPGGHVSTLWQS